MNSSTNWLSRKVRHAERVCLASQVSPPNPVMTDKIQNSGHQESTGASNTLSKLVKRPKPSPGRHGSGWVPEQAAPPAPNKAVPAAVAGPKGSLAPSKPRQFATAQGPLSLADTIAAATALAVLRGPVVILHIETTGPDPLHDDILAIHASRFDDNRVVEDFSVRVLPLRALTGPAAESAQSGRPPAKRKAVPLQEAIAGLCQFLGAPHQHVFIHGAAATQTFVGQAARQYGMAIENPVGDVVDLAKLAWPGRGDYSLSGLVEDLLPGLGTVRTAADATKAILALLQAASKALTAKGGRVNKSIAHWGTSEDCVHIRQMPW